MTLEYAPSPAGPAARIFIALQPRPTRPEGPSEDFVAGEVPDDAQRPVVLACADGVGSRPDAAAAARTAVDAFLAAVADGNDPGWALEYAHSTVREATNGRTTLVGAVVQPDGSAVVAWCGDSRAWLVRGGEARQVTTDHTLTARLLRQGFISAQEAADHAWRHVLEQALGSSSFRGGEVAELRLEPGDRLLLCTDGCNPAGPPRGDAADPAADYVSRARAAGTHDDAAAIALAWSGPPAT